MSLWKIILKYYIQGAFQSKQDFYQIARKSVQATNTDLPLEWSEAEKPSKRADKHKQMHKMQFHRKSRPLSSSWIHEQTWFLTFFSLFLTFCHYSWRWNIFFHFLTFLLIFWRFSFDVYVNFFDFFIFIRHFIRNGKRSGTPLYWQKCP